MVYLYCFFVYLFSDSHGTSRHSSRYAISEASLAQARRTLCRSCCSPRAAPGGVIFSIQNDQNEQNGRWRMCLPLSCSNHFTDLTIIFPFFRFFCINFPSFYQFNHHFPTIFKSSPLFNHHFQGFPITFPHFSLTVPGTLGAVHAVATAVWGWRATAMAETWCLFVTALLYTITWWVNGVYNTINPLWYAVIWLWFWFWYDYDSDYDYDIVQSCLIGENGGS